MTAVTNILMLNPQMIVPPPVYCFDSLKDDTVANSAGKLPEAFDIIATNPPWGSSFRQEKKLLKRKYPEIKSGESFSLFICRSVELTRKGGILSFVLPESISNVGRHSDIRRYISERTEILQIEKLGRIFRGVYTRSLSVELRKPPEGRRNDGPDERICISDGESQDYISRKDFISEDNRNFNININSRDTSLIDRIYDIPHITLSGRADWVLGIVTGDNSRFLFEESAEGLEPIIRGGDIEAGREGKGLIRSPKTWISFNPDKFQQAAPEWKYRAEEKLVYRFISNRPVFAVDRLQRLTLNSANCIIPAINGLSPDRLSMFLNSAVCAYLYRKRFGSVKVLRSHLEQLPIPEALMQAAEDGRMPALSRLFGLSSREVAYISEHA